MLFRSLEPVRERGTVDARIRDEEAGHRACAADVSGVLAAWGCKRTPTRTEPNPLPRHQAVTDRLCGEALSLRISSASTHSARLRLTLRSMLPTARVWMRRPCALWVLAKEMRKLKA